MKKSLLFHFALLTLIMVSMTAFPVSAQAERQVSDDEVNQVAKNLYCPVCENIPLDVCPTPACAQWRELIREKLSLGWSKEQIENYLVEQYGDQVLAIPPKSGLNWLIYALPPLIIIGGLVVVVNSIRRGKKSALHSMASVQPDQDLETKPYLQQIERDLNKED
jgi:cytochrome c-type biogenesis protein CcmH